MTKISKKINYLTSNFIHHTKNEGIKRSLTRSFNFLIFGKGKLEKPDIKFRNKKFVVYDKYTKWLENNENFNSFLIQKKINALTYKPKISIIIPVYNVSPKWLDKCIQSVINQFYDNWEICLYDDKSTNKKTVHYLKKLQKKNNHKIKIKFGEKNLHISGASNQALTMATGQFIGLLDNDDILQPHALYEVVKLLNIHSKADIIYSDEDKIDKKGNRKNPFFKPDWNQDLFLSLMYTCHFTVYRKQLLNKIKGFRIGYEGAQDYDLMLRAIEKTTQIHHIPKILYSWRIIPGSTAQLNKKNPEKNYAYKNAAKALKDFLQRQNIDGEIINENIPGHFRVKRKIIGNPLISIIIPFKDQATLLDKCLTSIFDKSTYKNFEIIGINNGSTEVETSTLIKKYKDKVHFVELNEKFNYSRINNWAISNFAKGEHILLLNNDIEIINPDWLEALLEHSQRPEIGAVGALLLYPNNKIQHAGVIVGLGGIAGHSHHMMNIEHDGYSRRPHLIQNISAVTGACLMTKKSLYMELNGLNKKDLKIAYNDVDFCLRLIKKGYLNVYTPYCKAYHYESISRGYEDTPEKQQRQMAEASYLIKSHPKIFKKGDPHYNRNLDYSNANFDIKINYGNPK